MLRLPRQRVFNFCAIGDKNFLIHLHPPLAPRLQRSTVERAIVELLIKAAPAPSAPGSPSTTGGIGTLSGTHPGGAQTRPDFAGLLLGEAQPPVNARPASVVISQPSAGKSAAPASPADARSRTLPSPQFASQAAFSIPQAVPAPVQVHLSGAEKQGVVAGAKSTAKGEPESKMSKPDKSAAEAGAPPAVVNPAMLLAMASAAPPVALPTQVPAPAITGPSMTSVLPGGTSAELKAKSPVQPLPTGVVPQSGVKVSADPARANSAGLNTDPRENSPVLPLDSSLSAPKAAEPLAATTNPVTDIAKAGSEPAASVQNAVVPHIGAQAAVAAPANQPPAPILQPGTGAVSKARVSQGKSSTADAVSGATDAPKGAAELSNTAKADASSQLSGALAPAQNQSPSNSDTGASSQPGQTSSAGDTFQRLDGAAPANPSLLHSSPHEVAVGVRDPDYGWVEIRTQSSAGQISASLTAGSSEAQAGLAAQLPGLTQHLADHNVNVGSVSVQGDWTQNGGAGQQGSQNPGQQAAAQNYAQGQSQGQNARDTLGSSGGGFSPVAPVISAASNTARRPADSSISIHV